ncbi:hypothetical protein BU17DRAFT_46359, partial [Hysterangium stoloniferum]
CGRFGHIARVCPNGQGFAGGSGLPPPTAPRAPGSGRGLNTASLPPVKCFRCGGPNHMSRQPNTRDCLAPPGTTVEQSVTPNGPGPSSKDKICYKCSQPGHIARECPQNTEYVA